ncbi:MULTISPECIES: uracil-DNA glycosylase [Sphingomonas]|uniref:uracil-DNA glycosylase n=1 Tax=Sphingomonas TaxID=13687 RepID=UPI000DEFD078|nr:MULTISPECIES: uracil-DNA glycosylase [Sphingomonas]
MLDGAVAASLLGWWLDAGVDVPVAEAPRDWLRQNPAAEPAPAAPIALTPAAATGRAALDSLDDYQAWLREGLDLPLFQAGAGRALPHGPAQAPLMIVADLPEREGSSEGRPITGEAWALTERMLAAIGFTPEQVYVAALACFPAPAGRLDPRLAVECGAEIRRHIALAAPQRLLLLGEGPAKALTGQGLVQARGRIHRIDHIPAVVTFHPRQLLSHPPHKAHAWRDLLLLMSEEIS